MKKTDRKIACEKPNAGAGFVSENLASWLLHPGADVYLGRRACFKLAILARLAAGSGESLAAIGKRFGASRQAANKHAQAARKSFGLVNPSVD